jgi:subtilisin family serine protease
MIVTAAGNESNNNDTSPSYPASYSLDNLIAVAATTRSDTLASYSNFGANTVELAAPGDQIVSMYNASDTSYAQMSGTSMAAPQVSGMLALLTAHYPADTAQQILSRAVQSVDPLPALDRDGVEGCDLRQCAGSRRQFPGDSLQHTHASLGSELVRSGRGIWPGHGIRFRVHSIRALARRSRTNCFVDAVGRVRVALRSAPQERRIAAWCRTGRFKIRTIGPCLIHVRCR